jgi:glycosyltransferase involved in cell wall biosynthesis
MSPLVSVVVPAFNAVQVIGRTLRSVSAQTYSRLEVLVVDDGSQDGTGGAVLEAAAKDPRIRLLRQNNQGVAAARNTGIVASRGDLVAPLDADDIWVPEKLEKQVAVFEASPPSVGLVYVWSAPVFDGHWAPTVSAPDLLEGPVYLPLVLGNFLANASTPLIRRACLTQVGLYDSSYRDQDAQGCEDWDLYLRIAEQHQFRIVPECLVGYHQGPATMSADWRRMDRSYRILMTKVRARHPQIPEYVFRWSEASFLVYLAAKVGRARLPGKALQFLSSAVLLDPWMFTYRRWHRLTLKNLLGSLGWHLSATTPPAADKAVAAGQDVPEPAGALRGSDRGIVRGYIMRRRIAHLLALQRTLGFDLRSPPRPATRTRYSL